MFKPIYQIASPMCDWRTVPKNVYDATNELLRAKLPPVKYGRRIVIEVTESELQSINTAFQIGEVVDGVQRAMQKTVPTDAAPSMLDGINSQQQVAAGGAL